MNVQGIFRRCFPVLNRVFEQKHVPRLPQTFVLLMRVGRSWNIVFQVVFSEIPTYQDIINRTPKVYPIFVMNKPKKESPVMEDSSVNLKWQGDCELKRIEEGDWLSESDPWFTKDFLNQVDQWYKLYETIVQKQLFKQVFLLM